MRLIFTAVLMRKRMLYTALACHAIRNGAKCIDAILACESYASSVVHRCSAKERLARMIDHIAIGVGDLEVSKAFFVRALAPLGMSVVADAPKAVGLGRDGIPIFWLDAKLVQTPPLHLAFVAENHAQVDAFYREALAAGGRDNGAPGLRLDYHPDYYAAFVTCPEGHNVEAVCRRRTG